MTIGRYLCAVGIGCSFAHRHALEARHCPVARELALTAPPRVDASTSAASKAAFREARASRPSDVSPRSADFFRGVSEVA